MLNGKSRWGNYEPRRVNELCQGVTDLAELCAYEQVLLGNHLAKQVCDCHPGVEKLKITVVTYLDKNIKQIQYVKPGLSGPLSWGKHPVRHNDSRLWLQERRQMKKNEKWDLVIFFSLYPLLEGEKRKFLRLKDPSEKIIFTSVFGPQSTSTGTSDFYAIS